MAPIEPVRGQRAVAAKVMAAQVMALENLDRGRFVCGSDPAPRARMEDRVMTDPDRLRRLLGPLGVWTFRFDSLAADEAVVAAHHIEQLGFPVVWIAEVGPTEALTLAGHLLASTSELVVANGIARVSDRSAGAAAAGHRYLHALSGGRHVLGLGLGGRLSSEGRPIEVMTGYLDQFDTAWGRLPHDIDQGPIWCLAAYNDRMVDLGAERSDGLHTYLITPDHTERIRARVGPAPVIAAETAVVLNDPADRDGARAIARSHVANYLGGRSHQRKFRALGFDDADFAEGGSDRLVDALVVYGKDALAERVGAHREAGADHVCVQVLGTTTLDDDLTAWSEVASLL